MLPSTTDYQDNIYANGRQINSRITFTINGSTNVYDDNYITQMTILEEMSTLNDSIPADELQVTLDNTGGTFNFLNLSNMHQIIAQRPKIVSELGLVLIDSIPQTIGSNFQGKIRASTVENGNISKYTYSDLLKIPSAITVESSQTGYGYIESLNGMFSSMATTLTAGLMAQHCIGFDIIRILTDKYGEALWQGKTSLADKVSIAKSILTKVTCYWHGWGSSPTGNKANLSIWNAYGSSWSSTKNHTNGAVTIISSSTTGFGNFLGSDGFMYWLAWAEPADTVTASTIRTDFVELLVEVGEVNVIEWQPLGTFYLGSWKNDVGAMTVTLIAHDNFAMLDNISFGGPSVGANKTLYALAVDVFTAAGITNYSIDLSLQNYTTTTGFKDKLTCREALQHIAIAGMCTVYQDRNGVMQIKPFVTIDAADNYITYAGSGLYAGFDPFDIGAYAKINDGNGMKRLDLDNMYTVPEINLGKSIYQLTVKVYSSIDVSTDFTKVNTAIAGQNGESFTIDNPLINTNELAEKVADWFILESNFNIVYKSNWRGNPILENADIVIISNGIDSTYAKQGRIYKQEFQYVGYLTCQTESRGGL